MAALAFTKIKLMLAHTVLCVILLDDPPTCTIGAEASS